MIEINRILIQLNTAVELANSDLPPKQNLAIILLDNLFEVQLYKRIEHLLILDRTTWYGGNRFYSKDSRSKVMRHYDHLLKVAKDAQIISENELELLKYVHNVRNDIYHKGTDADKKFQIVLLTYYLILKTNKNILTNNGLIGYTDSPGYDKIDFGQGLEIIDPNDSIAYIDSYFDHKGYFDRAFAFILNKLNVSGNITPIARQYLLQQIEDIEWRTDFILKECKWANFYGAVAEYSYLTTLFFEFQRKNIKPKGIDSILLIMMFLRLHKEDLDDIENLKERQKQGTKAYKSFRRKYKGRYPFFVDLSNIKNRLKNLPKNDGHKVIKVVAEIQLKIGYLEADIESASFHLDGYIQHLSDLARGK